MRGCPGCGTELMTAGCPNATCGMSMGGTYDVGRSRSPPSHRWEAWGMKAEVVRCARGATET